MRSSAVGPIYLQTYQSYKAKKKQIADPTSLIVVDEAGWLQSKLPRDQSSHRENFRLLARLLTRGEYKSP